MHITDLSAFINYTPIFDPDPQFLLEEIKQQAREYLSEDKINLIDQTYIFTLHAHQNVIRHSGEPYIVHPLSVAKILMDIKPDCASIQAALLHDVIEDTDITYDQLKEKFGQEVADLCNSLVKVSKIKYRWETRQIETIKKTFLAMAKDLRVIFIKMADRIHNIQTLHYHPTEEKRKRIALETLEIYVPISRRLWLYNFQSILENGSFKHLHSKEFDQIFNFLHKEFGDNVKYTDKGIQLLTELLKKEWIPVIHVSGRLKSPYRIFQKLENKYSNKELANVMDILAFRVLTDTVGNCYNAMWVIHGAYTPLIKKIKDYIAVPKSNNYQSLHTTVLGMFKCPVEIQIRTPEMDEVANYGVAAHFWYAETLNSNVVSIKQADWIAKMQNIISRYQSDNEWFKNKMNIELLDKNIFVYTPKWDIIELPEWSTVLDFAFKIHTDIGLRYKAGIINWIIVPIDTKIKTGDIVSIATRNHKYTASANRIQTLYTPSAKEQLIKYINISEKNNRIETTKSILNERLKTLKLPQIDQTGDKISTKYNKKEIEEILRKLYEKQLWYTTFINSIYNIGNEWGVTHASNTIKRKISQTLKDEIIIDWNYKINYEYCPECKPTVHNKIIAKITKDWIKIHTLSCKAIETITFDKTLEAHFQGAKQSTYQLQATFELAHKQWILMKLLDIYHRLNINIIDFNFVNINEKYAQGKVSADFIYPNKIAFLIKECKKYEWDIKLISKILS
jgi:guanosine-3',5'-bis(diphosphate) 3'-pyrophosphohydrolase